MQAAQRLAKRQANDIDRITDTSGRLTRLIYHSLKNNAKHHTPIDFDIDPRIVSSMIDVMARAYFERYKRHNRTRITLAVPSLKSLASQYDIELGRLRQQLEPLARQSLGRSVSQIQTVMRDAIAEATGKTERAAIRSITKRLHQFGVTPVNDSYIKTLVRTNTAIAYNAAEAIRLEDDEELWGYQYLAVNDDVTRPSHAAVSGTIRKKDDPFWDTWWPPNGYNCRCQVIPVYQKVRQTRVPNETPDEGFDFNPRSLISV